MENTTELTTLDRVTHGMRCRIAKVQLRGPVRRRLMDMGVVTGAEILVIRLAPLGDPMEIKIKDFLLSLRKDDAKFISVEILDNER
jgi:ferrous iron transport protein A